MSTNFLGTKDPAQFFWTPEEMVEENDYFMGDDYYMLETQVEHLIETEYVYKNDTKELFKEFFRSIWRNHVGQD